MTGAGCSDGRARTPQRVDGGSARPTSRQVDVTPRDRSSPCIVSSNSSQARHARRSTSRYSPHTTRRRSSPSASRGSTTRCAPAAFPASASAGMCASCARTSSAGSPTSAVRALAAAAPRWPRPLDQRRGHPRTPVARTRRRASGPARSAGRSRSCWHRRGPSTPDRSQRRAGGGHLRAERVAQLVEREPVQLGAVQRLVEALAQLRRVQHMAGHGMGEDEVAVCLIARALEVQLELAGQPISHRHRPAAV